MEQPRMLQVEEIVRRQYPEHYDEYSKVYSEVLAEKRIKTPFQVTQLELIAFAKTNPSEKDWEAFCDAKRRVIIEVDDIKPNDKISFEMIERIWTMEDSLLRGQNL